MPSRPFGATAVDIRHFSKQNLVHLVIAQRRNGCHGRVREYRYLCATKVLCGFGRCASRREGGEVDGRGFARKKLRHDAGGDGGEEDAVAVGAGGGAKVGGGW